jgi:glycosidase
MILVMACATPYSSPPAITSQVEDWRDEVIYQVVVDRFADGDVNNNWNITHDPSELTRYHGGDWQGLIDHVDYLEALGVSAIWISPIVENVEEDAGIAGYHGYWTRSFVDVNPHFGDLLKLRELVDVMHQHGIKVIVDIVVNHIGQLFYYDINQNGQPDITTWYATDGSDSLDIVTEWDPAFDSRGIQSFTSLGESGPAPLEWVYMPEITRTPPEPAEFWDDSWYHRRGRVTDWGDLEQVQLGDFPGGLKDLATEREDVREALVAVFSDWITQTDIDGYRIDTVKHVEREFWQVFTTAIRAHAQSLGKENFFLFGEVFDGDDALIGSYTGEGLLDSNVYFSQKYQVFDGVFKGGGPTSTIKTLFDQRDTHYGTAPTGPAGIAARDLLVNFLDNHDVPRFLYGESDTSALKAALLFQLTEDGIPCIYYGTEAGFNGGNDPANREPLWLAHATDHELFSYISSLTQLRRSSPALSRGSLNLIWTTDHVGEEEDAGILAFERWYQEEGALVLINTHPFKTSVTAYGETELPVSFAPGTTLTQAWPPEGAGSSWTVSATGTLRVELAPRFGLVLW